MMKRQAKAKHAVNQQMRKFLPTWTLENILQITPEQAYRHNIKAILTDLDNTLIPWDSKQVPLELKIWAEAITQAGVEILILSNNKSQRVKEIAQQLGVAYLAPAYKPRRIGYRRAMAYIKSNKEETVFVGDQLLTDVLGASRFGLRSILVKPVADSDGAMTRFNRKVEKQLIKFFKQRELIFEWRDQLD